LKSLPDTTVIFVFVNEAESVLYRSIHSVLNRTPPRLLKEIILVDDGSDAPHLQEPLERAVNALPKVRLIRLGKRSGLVKARLAGARAATSRTITILDSHIEVQHGWLEPLMNRIRQDSHHVVMPIIDGMDGSTFEASKYGKIEVLGFLWSMVEHGIKTQKIHEDQRSSKHTDPEPSPTMAGGLFSMDREYFFRLGGYDEEFGFWGAENLEISFRIWQCGGTIEVMPCSRVYHIFRKGGKPYKTNTGDVVKNKLRTAAIWMDDYAKYAYDLIGKNPDTFDVGPLDKMKELRKSLNCKSFSWYLENVYPENSVRILERARKRGALRSKKTNRCLDDMGQKRNMGKPEFYPCHNSGGSQSWMFTERNEIRPGRDWDRCLDGTADKQSAFIYDCHGLGGNQKWQLRSDGSVKHVSCNSFSFFFIFLPLYLLYKPTQFFQTGSNRTLLGR
jgi:polypeptide N-acetylgalactosaminyltransferase